MTDIEITMIVKDGELKADAEEGLREMIALGRAEVFTFEEFGVYLVKLAQPAVDRLAGQIKSIQKAVGVKPEPEAEEIEVPTPNGDEIAAAALATWHRSGKGGSSITRPLAKDPPEPRPGPRIKPDADLEFIPPPENDLTVETRATWRESLRKRTRQGWGFFNSKLGGKHKK